MIDTMTIRYSHTNLIAKNWKQLADFYVNVFGCKQTNVTHLSGEYLEKGTGIEHAALEGINLLLPGYETQPPLLEIFQYTDLLEKTLPVLANREGYGHIAFQVDDIEAILIKAIEYGGKKIGEVATKEYSKGTSTYIYIADPEGNIVELQNWVSM